MKTPYLLLLLAVCLSSVASKSGGDPIELRLNMPVGKTYTTTIKAVSQIQTGTRNFEMNLESWFSMTATGTNAELTSIQTIIQAMKLSVPALGKNYDSTTRKKGSPKTKEDEIIGKSFTVVMNKQASVKEINGLDAVFKDAGGDDNIKTSLSQGVAEFPVQPVAPGDSWESETVANTKAMSLHFINKWTLDNVSNGIAYISVRSTYVNNNGEADRDGNVWSGTQSGSFQVEIATGMTLKSDFVQETNVDLKGEKASIKTTVTLETK